MIHMAAADIPRSCRAVFISDVHLGMRNCQAEALMDLLRHVEADTYYLVGDIVDFWKFGNNLHWPQPYNDVMQKLLRKVRKGARIIYIPGNHDDGLRAYAGMQFGGITIQRDAIHLSARGKRYLVMHGDEFDVVMKTARWLAYLGDRGYDIALWLNNPLNWLRRHLGRDYWSIAAFLKGRVKQAISFISHFESFLADEARSRGADGVICGHIHQPANRMIEDVHYLNCGDWVESCTAIIETDEGEFRLVHHRDLPRFEAVPPALHEAALALP